MKLLFSNLWCKNPRINRAVDRLKEAEADLIVLSELSPVHSEKVIAQLRSYPYFKVVSPNPVGSIAIFSRYPITDFEELNKEEFNGRPQGLMRIGYQSGFQLLAVHASAPWTYPRYLRRNRQLSAISKLVKNLNEPLIIAGDFNASHRVREMQRLKKHCDLEECRNGERKQPSWPMFGSFWCIDHLFYSNHFQMKQFQCLDFVYSDHLPVIAEFTLN